MKYLGEEKQVEIKTVSERQIEYMRCDKCGKKILLTGNGKCNLSNKNINENCYNNYMGFKIASLFDVEQYFNDLGLLTSVDSEGRVYPYSSTATSVLNILSLSK